MGGGGSSGFPYMTGAGGFSGNSGLVNIQWHDQAIAQQQAFLNQAQKSALISQCGITNVFRGEVDTMSKFKVGDRVRHNTTLYTFTIVDIGRSLRNNISTEYLVFDKSKPGYWSDECILIKEEPKQETFYTGVKHMLKSVTSDLKSFIVEHKSAIYWVAVLMLVDHVAFDGAFREKLKGLMNKLVGKVEAQLDKAVEKV